MRYLKIILNEVISLAYKGCVSGENGVRLMNMLTMNFRGTDLNNLEYLTSHNLPGNFYWKDNEGHCLGCNEGLLKLFRLSSKNFIEKKDAYLWLENTDIFEKYSKEVIIERKTLTFEEMITLNGEKKTFLITESPWVNEQNVVMGVIGSLTDTSLQKKKESELKKENFSLNLYLSKIIEGAPGNLYWKSKDGVYLGCNNFMVQISNLKLKSDIIGKTDQMLWPQYAAYIEHNDNRVLQLGETFSLEEEVGGRIYLSTKMPLRNENNEIIGIIGNSVDISHLKEIEFELRKAKEEAEIANQAKTEFLENMRHDIRTPIAGILGSATLIKSKSNNPEVNEYVDTLIASGNALLNFMNEVLDVVSVNSGEIPLLKKKFNLELVLKEVIELHLARAKERVINLQLIYDEKIPKYVVGDSRRIYRIVLELLANALNFTNKGDVTVSAVLARKDNNKIIIKLAVEDTGIGIPLDKQQVIFTRFKRLSASSSGIYQGSGLGLTIAKQFIDDLAAEIYVHSQPNKGSTFSCIIPLQESLLDDEFGVDKDISFIKTAKKEVENNTLVSHAPNKIQVLVVEDHPITAKITKAIITELNCEVDVASDGLTALAQVQSKSYDVIFMDVGLPDIDGCEVTRRIRLQKSSTSQDVLIVGLTAHIGANDKQRCIEAGMNVVFTKPLQQEKIEDFLKVSIPKYVSRQV